MRLEGENGLLQVAYYSYSCFVGLSLDFGIGLDGVSAAVRVQRRVHALSEETEDKSNNGRDLQCTG